MWSFLAAYQRYQLRPLGGAEADRYLDEMAVVAERLGAAEVPRSRAQVEAYLDGVRPELAAGDEALDTVAFLMVLPPGDAVLQAAYALVVQAAVGLLPSWVRGRLRLRQLPRLEWAVLRPATWNLLNAIRLAVGPAPALV